MKLLNLLIVAAPLASAFVTPTAQIAPFGALRSTEQEVEAVTGVATDTPAEPVAPKLPEMVSSSDERDLMTRTRQCAVGIKK